MTWPKVICVIACLAMNVSLFFRVSRTLPARTANLLNWLWWTSMFAWVTVLALVVGCSPAQPRPASSYSRTCIVQESFRGEYAGNVSHYEPIGVTIYWCDIERREVLR
jgi:hypothetical protein